MTIYTTAQICGEIITVTNYCGEMNDTFFTIRSGSASVVMEAEHIRALSVALDAHIDSLKARLKKIHYDVLHGGWSGTEAEADAEISRIKAKLAKLEVAT